MHYKCKDSVQAEHAYFEVLDKDLCKQVAAEHSARSTKHVPVY